MVMFKDERVLAFRPERDIAAFFAEGRLVAAERAVSVASDRLLGL